MSGFYHPAFLSALDEEITKVGAALEWMLVGNPRTAFMPCPFCGYEILVLYLKSHESACKDAMIGWGPLRGIETIVDPRVPKDTVYLINTDHTFVPPEDRT